MDFYTLLKLLHIVAAIKWVGGASLVTALVLLLMQRADDEALRFLSNASRLNHRVFMPAALLTIVSGLLLAWLGSWGFTAWTVLAGATVAVTSVLGGAVLSPMASRALALWRKGDTPAAAELSRRVIRLTRFDLAAQWAIISLMVLKPSWGDVTLLLPASLILLGMALALTPVPRAAQPA